MRASNRRHWKVAAAAVGAVALLTATACGGGDTAEDGEITLTIDTFGVFGYDALFEQYMEENPNITIEENNLSDLNADYVPALQQNIAAGDGAGDIVAIEEGIVQQFYLSQSDNFVDLGEYGAADIEGNYLPWKWELGKDAEGRVVGLGTDIGGMSMCYNKSLFEDAGLPTDREEVGARWETWEDFIALGEEFQKAETGASFVSTVTPYFNAMNAQGGTHTFFDTENNLVAESNPVITDSWDLAEQMADKGLSANLPMWSDEWNAGIQNNVFATLPCPAWMLGHIESTAGESGRDRWDVASVPGNGGNWGGSWLSVTTQSEHPEEAADLAMFLSSPEGQTSAWNEANTLPSSPQALEDPAVTEFTRDYFNQAPVGAIYSETAQQLEPVYYGVHNAQVSEEFRKALEAMEQGQASPSEAWDQAISNSERAAGQ
ncbi:ABC transporter substrate-binding protein [Actinorugispora endophytica]|uniref:Cellobiose transport system substrate-binding protein n=1 Tax=Actinorugispora endophytica TaxID=1605990 RepID=A0A4R6V7T9_9ACTN|nr:extracellular solute-binding protein [Actinorugispora endophytica]TDQ52406.1 cellobiose transport system substrate-binding protein [Actinorugispora endophytica]